jgi:hypothetical protein
VSFFRPKLPENKPVNLEASLRLRGLKGLEPTALLAMNDAFWAGSELDHWCLSAVVAGAAGNNSKIGIQTPNDPRLIWIVDNWSATSAIASDPLIVGSQLALGTGVMPVFTVDTNVWLRNRPSADVSGGPTRVGAFRIIDNGIVGVGTELDRCLPPAALSMTRQRTLGFCLFANEALYVMDSTVNTTLHATLAGRMRRL